MSTATSTPCRAMAANASTPALPGTKYGETNRNARSGAPMLSVRRCQSKASSGARPSPFAGSSLTIRVGDQSKVRRRVSRSRTNGELARASMYAAAAGSCSTRPASAATAASDADVARGSTRAAGMAEALAQ